MPADFTLVLAGSTLAPDVMYRRVDVLMQSRGFQAGPELLVSDPKDGGDSPAEVALPIDDVLDGIVSPADWSSLYADYSSDALTLGLQFDVDVQGFNATMIFIEMDKMYEMHSGSIPQRFYELVGDIAAACGSTGGYGGFEAELRNVAPVRGLARLLAEPGDESLWFDLHIVELSRANAAGTWHDGYERLVAGSFAFFVKRDFLAMCEAFAHQPRDVRR